MEAAKRIALLLLGLGVGDVLAEEPGMDEDRASPIFVVRTSPPVPPPAPPISSPKTVVQQQLLSLLRSEIAPAPAPAPEVNTPEMESGETGHGQLLRLEKMTVRAPRLPPPPMRESTFERFTRTGYLWEFSPTKRFMIGPKDGKVGVMFSFDW